MNCKLESKGDTMKGFDIFYFENFVGDFDEFNPRFVMHQPYIKDIISIVGRNDPFECSLDDIKEKLNLKERDFQKCINLLLNVSAIKVENQKLALSFPFFNWNDCKIIKKIVMTKIKTVEEFIEKNRTAFIEKLKVLYPNINQKESLYHLLCGKVFDGSMFNFLEKKGLLSQTFSQKDNRDYMLIGYENDKYCRNFNSELFCSFNHARYKNSSLSSFGNASGDRFDYFRYFRLREKNDLHGKFLKVDKDLKNFSSEEIIENSLNILMAMHEKKKFEKDLFYINLKRFGYISEDDVIKVPIFDNYIEKCAQFSDFVFNKIGNLIIQNFDEIKAEILKSNIICIKHKVSIKQLSNELWHIYFGLLNKCLVDKKIVATPQHFRGEGRYLKCVYLSK